jgi:pimeloyl-ACP methyl ester carboxylesterase
MFLSTPGGPLYFEIGGEGPPLVFASGWAMSCECWRPAVALLERKYRCLIYDPRGIARSQPFSPPASFTIEDHAEDLHSIIEHMGMFDAAIIGHEAGMFTAGRCASVHPQDARALCLVSPRPAVSKDDVKRLALFTPASLALRELAAYPVIRNIVARRFSRAPQPFRDRLFDDFAGLDPRAAYETALSASAEESAQVLERLIERGTLPVMLVCGERDKKASVEGRRLFSLAKSARLATLRGSGFLPMLEYPLQFARLIDDFARKSGNRSRQSLLRRQP